MESLLSEQASERFVKAMLDLVERKAEELVQKKTKRYLIQKEVMKEYSCTPKDLKEWEMKGLKKFRRGKTWIYDRKDIETLFEALKK